MEALPKPPRVVAVTGSRTFIGTELLRALSDDPSIDQLIAIDIDEPDVVSDKLHYYPVDLTAPGASRSLRKLFADHKPDTLVHAAFLSTPSHKPHWAHELEDEGTLHLLDACEQELPTRLMLVSTTLVYGAKAVNPNYLDEDSSITGIAESHFVNDKVRAEAQVLRFARQFRQVHTCSMRLAPTLGPTIDNVYTRFLSRPVAPFVIGYDPLLQCVHESDAARACLMALRRSARGPFNIVGRDVLPYSTLLAWLGRVPLPLPGPIARWVGQAMWATHLSEVPADLLQLLKYPCVASGAKAERELGFVARYDIRETLSDLLGMPEDQLPPSSSYPSDSKAVY